MGVRSIFFQDICALLLLPSLYFVDLTWTLFSSRETGALNRIIDRGSRAINFILSSMVFNVVPTILEVWFSYSLVAEFIVFLEYMLL